MNRPPSPVRTSRPLLRRLAHARRLAAVLLSSQYAYMLEYRAEIVLWALSGVLPSIMLGLWSAVDAGDALALSSLQLARYFLAVFVVRQFTIVWVMYSFEEDNLNGRLSPYLLQPLPVVWRYVAAHLSEQATRLPFVAMLAGLFFLLYPAAFWRPSLSAALLTVLATLAAFALRFLMQFTLTMVCFWSEKASALERLLYLPYLYLSGLVAPLALYPEAVRAFAFWTPFPYMIDVPARILTGEPVAVGQSFAAMAAWAGLLLPLNWLLWRRGLRHYSAMGA